MVEDWTKNKSRFKIKLNIKNILNNNKNTFEIKASDNPFMAPNFFKLKKN